MFDDPKKELKALEKQLLEDEAWFEKELDSAKRMIGQVPQKSLQATAPRTPQAPKPAVKAVPASNAAPAKQKDEKAAQPKKKGIRGLVILASLESLGILGLIVYWLLFILK